MMRLRIGKFGAIDGVPIGYSLSDARRARQRCVAASSRWRRRVDDDRARCLPQPSVLPPPAALERAFDARRRRSRAPDPETTVNPAWPRDDDAKACALSLSLRRRVAAADDGDRGGAPAAARVRPLRVQHAAADRALASRATAERRASPSTRNVAVAADAAVFEPARGRRSQQCGSNPGGSVSPRAWRSDGAATTERRVCACDRGDHSFGRAELAEQLASLPIRGRCPAFRRRRSHACQLGCGRS